MSGPYATNERYTCAIDAVSSSESAKWCFFDRSSRMDATFRRYAALSGGTS
jgi:hypothetical protein